MAFKTGGAPSGYGPAQQSHVSSLIPIFSGDKNLFHPFHLALKSALLDVGCDIVLVSADEWKKRVDAAPMGTRSADAATDKVSGDPSAKDDKDVLAARERFVARVLWQRLAPDVVEKLRAILSEDEANDGNAVWCVLQQFYSMPAGHAAQKKRERNPEQLLYEAATSRPRKNELPSAYIQRLRIEMAIMFKSPRLSTSENARKFVVGLLLRSVLEHSLSGRKEFEELYDKTKAQLLHDTQYMSLTALEELQKQTEEIEVKRRLTPASQHARPGKQGGWPGKHKGADQQPRSEQATQPGKQHSSHQGGGRDNAGGKAAGGKGGHRPDGRHDKSAKPKIHNLGAAQADEDPATADDAEDGVPVNASAYVPVSVSQSGRGQQVRAVQVIGNGQGQAVDACSSATISTLTHGLKTKPAKAFLVDSGATHHCVRLRSMFTDYQAGDTVVTLPNGRTLVSPGSGTVQIQLEDSKGGSVSMTMSKVLYVPQLSNNIFSTNKFVTAKKGNRVVLDGDTGSALVLPTKHRIPLHAEGALLWMLVKEADAPRKKSSKQKTGGDTQPSMGLQELHVRLGHLNLADCKHLAHQCGIKLSSKEAIVCEVCQTAKLAKTPIAAKAHREPVQPGAIIHVDIKGPVDEPSMTGAKLAIVFVDQCTRYTVVKELQSKDQCVLALQEAIGDFARIPGAPIKIGAG